LTRRDSGVLIEGMARRRDHHSLAFLVAVIVTASGATRGLCFMPGTAEPGPRDAHTCCKTAGWAAAAPECCMTRAADEAPARAAVPTALSAPAAIRLGIVQQPASSRLAAGLAPGDRSHSPPGRAPLRI